MPSPGQLTACLRAIRFHDLRHSTATIPLEQDVEFVVIKKPLGHAHIGVAATVYAHVRLQRQAIDLLGHAPLGPSEPNTKPDDGDDSPVCAAPVHWHCRNCCRHNAQKPHQSEIWWGFWAIS